MKRVKAKHEAEYLIVRWCDVKEGQQVFYMKGSEPDMYAYGPFRVVDPINRTVLSKGDELDIPSSWPIAVLA